MGFTLLSQALDVILKGVFANAIKGHAFQKTRRDNPVGINIIAAQRDARAGKGADYFSCLLLILQVFAHVGDFAFHRCHRGHRRAHQ